MKQIKVIALVIITVAVVVVAGLFIFIKTLDLNQYLPQITKTASAAMGRELSIDHANLSLTLKGVVLSCEGVHVKGLVDVKRVQAGLDFGVLVAQRKLNFNNIQIDAINLNIPDPKMPLTIIIPQMTATVSDFSLTEPYQLAVDFAFASSVENIHLKMLTRLDSKQGKIVFSDIVFNSDLSQLDMSLIRQISPLLSKAMLPVSLEGQVNLTGSKLILGAKGLEDIQAHLVIDSAGAKLKELLTPISKGRIDAEISLSKMNIIEFHFHIGEGSINGQGEITDYMRKPVITSKGNIDRIKIEDLIDQSVAPVVLKGKVIASGNLSAESFDPAVFLKTLKGQGEFSVEDGVIEKLNVAKAVLGSTLGIIPGLAEGLDQLLSGTIKDKLGEDATVLQEAKGRFTVEDSVVYLDDARAVSKAFELIAKGTVGLDMKTDVNTSILLTKNISDDLSGKVEQLGYLRDDSGRIKISGQLVGVIPALSFKPNADVKNVAKSALVEEGGKQLEKVIEKNPKVGAVIDSIFGKDPATVDSSETTEDSKTKAKKAINNVLNSIFK